MIREWKSHSLEIKLIWIFFSFFSFPRFVSEYQSDTATLHSFKLLKYFRWLSRSLLSHRMFSISPPFRVRVRRACLSVAFAIDGMTALTTTITIRRLSRIEMVLIPDGPFETAGTNNCSRPATRRRRWRWRWRRRRRTLTQNSTHSIFKWHTIKIGNFRAGQIASASLARNSNVTKHKIRY